MTALAAAATLGGATAHGEELAHEFVQDAPLTCTTIPIGPLPAGLPDIRRVEVCPDTPSIGGRLYVGYDVACRCVTLMSPSWESDVHPNHVRVYTGTGVIEHRYPFTSARITGPAFCIYTNDPAYSGSPCLL